MVSLVERGATVALVGPAGIGKSTLVAGVAVALEARGEVVRRLPVAPTLTPIPWSGIAPLVDGAIGGDAFTSAFADLTAARSSWGVTILVVEAADHLDEPSAAVLHPLSSTGQVTLLLTMRSSTRHPLPTSHLLRQDNAATVTVPPLPDRDAAAMHVGDDRGSRANTVELTHPLYADVLRASMGVLPIAHRLTREQCHTA